MPDWFYRTASRPLLFRLPAAAARDLALGLMGALARSPGGPLVIDLLGHMRADPRLRRALLGITFPSPVGLGVGIDASAVALPALARFGFGFLEVGPVTPAPWAPPTAVERRPEQEAIRYAEPPASPGLDALAGRLERSSPLAVPLLVRLGYLPGAMPEQASADCRRMAERLAPSAGAFTLATAANVAGGAWSVGQWREHVGEVLRAVRGLTPARPVLVCLPPDLGPEASERLVGPALEAGADGLLIEGAIRAEPSGRLAGAPARGPALEAVRHVRQRWGSRPAVVASGGVHEPQHALELFEAGADLVQIDTGLVYAGPGLPKRVNEAVLFCRPRPPAPDPGRPPEMAWFWTLMLGVSMLLGGTLALAIASTRVVLPYDEALAGMTRLELAEVNDRLLAFMAHDRVSLAGTMIAIGVLYVLLSWYGVRRGLHWARQAVLFSSFAGFGSFFLFLGFGYFDPFHAFVTAVLFQFLLLALHSRLPAPAEPAPPNLREDWRWRWSQWGQFLFVVQGSAYLAAGLAISWVGVTRVFVPEDLEFLRTTREALLAAHPRLVPLVAHDRATFGGMLIATGLTVLLSALWGYRQGARWLWWALLASGSVGYAAAIGVHFAVGYTSAMHLAPAFAGLAIFVAGLVLSYPYLCRPDAVQVAAWKRYRREDGS
jgi:dihydroorotate dehydrogenase